MLTFCSNASLTFVGATEQFFCELVKFLARKLVKLGNLVDGRFYWASDAASGRVAIASATA
jgi:hypothetical protein